MADPLTENARAIINSVRSLYGQDGQTLTILNGGSDSAGGYVAGNATIVDFVIHPKRMETDGPTLEIVPGDGSDQNNAIMPSDLTGVSGTSAPPSAFAIGDPSGESQVLKVTGTDLRQPVGNPQVFQFGVLYTGEVFP